MSSMRSDMNVNEEEDEGEAEISMPKKVMDETVSLLGMVFSSVEEAEGYYRNFGERNGFDILKRTMYKSKKGLPNGVLFTCVCEGKHRNKSKSDSKSVDDGKIRRCTSTIKTGCCARMRIKWCIRTDSWKCSIFCNDHNHFMASPDKRKLMKSNKIMSQSTKDLAVAFNENCIGTVKVDALYGPDAMFDKRDVWNHMRWHRSINYEESDVENVKRYFQDMARKDPEFFYAIQCDTDGRAANFFWVDAESRRAYSQFGDVVTFDTTYRTNQYCMPFAPFTGVNHHRQSILFGCALLENEQEYTFVWLFETWLQAMGGKAPISIITNQDIAMGNAIALVFPHSRHRLCLWHIKKKFGEKLGQVYAKRSKFKRAVKKCTRGARSIEDFEEQWSCLMQEYGLQDNSWLQGMYDIRKSWIPIYCRDTFFAGMNTTQRSESMNAFFNGWVDHGTKLMTFVTQFSSALETIHVTERREDFASRYTKRVLHSKDLILAHVADIYTRNMFKLFAQEVEDVPLLLLDEMSVDRDIYTLLVFYKVGNRQESVVTFNLTTKIGSCECQLFQFLGLPCKHLVKVIDHLRIFEIPTHFILKRWCKDANRVGSFGLDGLPITKNNDEVVSRVARVSELRKLAVEVAHEAGGSERVYKLYKDLLIKALAEYRGINELVLQEENNAQVNNNDQPNEICPLTSELSILGTQTSRVENLLSESNISQTKCRKRTDQGNDNEMDKDKHVGNNRIKYGIEKTTKRKKQRVCRKCNNTLGLFHDSRNCPKNQNANGSKGSFMEPSVHDESEDLEAL